MSQDTAIGLPRVVSRAEWLAAREALLMVDPRSDQGCEDGRGVEYLGSNWSYLDLTPFGRQEDWEDSPEGWPQTPRYGWWRHHDKYEAHEE
jgi:predicted dithiol-disulfide oxidoreductase (DUF899 family)